MQIIRKTQSVCPKCIKKIKADLVEEDGKVYMLKKCKGHGRFKVLISTNSVQYKELNKLYFSLDLKNKKQNYYNLYLTLKCNLNCPICYTNANIIKYNEPSIENIQSTLRKIKNAKIGLWGGEPTLRKDLVDIIKIIKKSGNYPALLTNGIFLKDKKYTKNLKRSGLDLVHLQFDSFDDSANIALRGKSLIKTKNKILKNLKELEIPTVLEVTLQKGINVTQIKKIFDFAVKNKFVKAVLFRSRSSLGIKNLYFENNLPPSDIIREFSKQINNNITESEIYSFQKLFFIFCKFLNINKCLNDFFYIVSRNNGGYKQTLDSVKLYESNKHLFFVKSFKKNYLNFLILLFKSLNKDTIKLMPLLFSLLNESIFNKRFTSSTLQNNYLIIGFESICDKFNFDYQVIKNCPVGEIMDSGIDENSALSHIKIEKKIKNEYYKAN